MLAGCTANMSSIDRRLDKILGAGTSSINGEAHNPSRQTSSDSIDRTKALSDRTPATTNLAASELRFTPADEAKSVAARLNEYTNPLATSDNALVIDLTAAWKQSQLTGREYLASEEEYIFAAIRLLTEQHRWSPRLFNDTSATVSGSGNQGNFQHALDIINTLRLTQRLPFGGDVEARWVTSSVQQLREQVSDRYRQSGEIALSANVPLLRGAGIIAQEDIIQAERDLIYQARTFERFRRSYLVTIANDYFNLVNQRNRIKNQEAALESFKELYKAESARVDAGRRPAFQRNITENQVLSAQSTLSSQRESFRLALDRFKIRLGLPPSQMAALSNTELVIPRPESTEDQASSLALEYRLDLQTQRDRLDDTRRAALNAKNELLPDLDLRGNVGIPTDPRQNVGGVNFDRGDLDYSTSLTLSLPLDRETERLNLKRAIIVLESRKRDLDRQRDEVYVAARSALRRIDQAAFQLDLAEQAVKINESRREEQLLKADEVEPQRLVDSNNDLLRSQNDRDQARTDLRLAILNYLLETDQLRVSPDGTLLPLPGMPETTESTDPAAPVPPAPALPVQNQPVEGQ